MTAKIRQKSQNIREELTALSFVGAENKKVYLNNLVDNGDFSNGTTGWNSSYSNLTSTNGTLLVTNTANNGWAYQTINTEAGKTYRISVNVVTENANNLWFVVSSDTHPDTNQLLNKVVSTTGVQTETFVATGSESTVILRVNGASGANIEFDNVSVQEVGENMTVNGTFDYDSAWNKGTGWTISGGTASCDGSQTSNVSFKQDQETLRGKIDAGKQYTLTFTLSGHSGGGVNPHIRNLGHGVYITGNGTYTIVLTAGTGNDGLNFYAQDNFVGSIDNVILTEGSHHAIQSLPKTLDISRVFINGLLAREGENYDYEIKTDGINQWLKPTVEPTSTTETAVIGVYK